MSKTIVHVVKKGENLDKIARSYGLKTFKRIYADPINAKFRKLRPDPNLIQPGDMIIIPNYALTPENRKNLKQLISIVDDRIKKLEKLKNEFEASNNAAKREISRHKNKFKKTGNAVDIAAAFVNICGSLIKIGAQGLKMANMKAAELAVAEKEILKEVGKKNYHAIEPALGIGAEAMSKSTSDSISYAGILLDSFFKMSSPKFWGKTIMKAHDEGMLKKIANGKFGEGWDAWSKAVNWDPLKEFEAMNRNIENAAKPILKSLSDAIASDKKLMKTLKTIEKS